jgi:hypothetical protein
MLSEQILGEMKDQRERQRCSIGHRPSLASLRSPSRHRRPLPITMASSPFALPSPPPPPDAPLGIESLDYTFGRAAASIRSRLPANSALSHPVWAVVCGSGLSGLVDVLVDRIDIDYRDIEGFGEATGILAFLKSDPQKQN